MSDWMRLADTALEKGGISREDAARALAAPEAEAWDILAAAHRVRRRHHGNVVKVHVLRNARMGGCPEDCGFCSQSARFQSGVERSPLQEADEIVEGARRAHAAGGSTYCIVTATRGPSDADLDVLCDAVKRIKAEMPLGICTSLGLLDGEKARRLAEAGVDRFNHNLETSERLFPEVCSTHSFKDRLETLHHARAAGMELCCGGILGMGETDEDLLDLAFSLKEVAAESIPVNFLDPRPGTPLADRPRPSPLRCLQVLAVFRLVHPAADIRAAGGREVNLRSLQSAALLAANSIFTEGYLTTPGNAAERDRRMIEDAGFTLQWSGEEAATAV